MYYEWIFLLCWKANAKEKWLYRILNVVANNIGHWITGCWRSKKATVSFNFLVSSIKYTAMIFKLPWNKISFFETNFYLVIFKGLGLKSPGSLTGAMLFCMTIFLKTFLHLLMYQLQYYLKGIEWTDMRNKEQVNSPLFLCH